MIIRRLLSTLLLLASGGAGSSQSADAQQVPLAQFDRSRYVQHLMDLQVAFTSPPPTGISVAAKEVARHGSSGKDLVVQYQIFLKGIPENTLLTSWQLPVEADKLSETFNGISVGKDGVLICAGRTPEQCGDAKNPDDPIEFTFQPLKGEPSRLVFTAGQTRIGLMIVPDPVEAHNKGCSLTATRLSTSFQLAFLSGDGYTPDTDIHYRFISDATKEDVIRSDANGVIRIAMLAHSSDKKNGRAVFEITEKNCSPKVSYEWGNP
ncbi:hypothetical protein [Tunturiibacter gelidiferens]|uniref:Uncharacterized protein n=1 Tax=Tunturiibacter gelidiferens TaxID=3069689 RepID=A0AAU7Z2L3_9BACT